AAPFPSTVLSSRRLPFLDRVPASPVPRRPQFYGGATTSRSRIPSHLFVSLPGPTLPPLFVSRSLRSRGRGGRLPGQDPCSTGDPIAGVLSRGRAGISQVPRQSLLCLCLVP